ncbi:hypothetical protein IW144_003419 [Coemansia sp. RSA 522]|nr:hypothetical protein IW144_003419 [Coemansia sp. RSA 522]
MGVMCSLYSLWDIVDDTVKRKVNESDATKFAQKTHCSSRCCGALWLLVALISCCEMETGGPLAEQLLDASALEHIHNGDWTSQVNNQL